MINQFFEFAKLKLALVLIEKGYYPYGMLMPGRKFTATSSYRYGFNGQEKSTEINGTDNLTTAEYWEYDSRTGRRWNPDPIVKYSESPYLCFSDNPILFTDVNGDEAHKPKNKGTSEGQTQTTEEKKFVPSAGAKGGTWETITTKWNWHEGGITGADGKKSEAGWYDPADYAKILSPVAKELAVQGHMLNGAAGMQLGGYKSGELAKFVKDGLSVNTAQYLIAQAHYLANDANFRVTGTTYATSFNVEDMLGVGLVFKEGLKILATIAAKNVEQRVFWAGGEEAMNAATQYAKSAPGRTTIGMTRAGQNLDNLIKIRNIPWEGPGGAREMWQRLSIPYAKGAKGSAPFFTGPNGFSPFSIWNVTEKTILQQRGIPIIPMR